MKVNYYLSLIVILLLTSFNAQAQNLAPFDVRYHVYRGNVHVANSQFSLTRQGSEWVWNMKTAPKGIYSWLTRKKPFTETRMHQHQQNFQLLLESTGDYPKKPPKDVTWFDYSNKKIYRKKSKKIKQQKLLKNVYNYHSVHLLHSQMSDNGSTQMDINFYRKGNLINSTLTLQQQVELPSKSGAMIVDKITQTFKDSKKKMIYYYQGNTLAPLKIEQIKPGKDISVMWRITTK